MAQEQSDGFDDLTPINLDLDASRPWVRWLDLRGIEAKEPAFSGTVKKAAAMGRRDALTEPGELLEAARRVRADGPSVFVFHGARAGTTALSLLLRRASDVRVFNEPFATCMAVAHSRFPDEPSFLRAVIACLGRREDQIERQFGVVLSSWTVLRLDSIAEAFPGVPLVYVYRDPLEVVGSLVDYAPKWANPPRSTLDTLVGQSFIGERYAEMPDEEFFARTIGRFNSSVLARSDVTLLNYSELGALSTRALGERLKLRFGPEATERIDASRAALMEHERRMQKPLRDEGSIIAAVEAWAKPSYDELEARRLSSLS